jgi:hypothetical protein
MVKDIKMVDDDLLFVNGDFVADFSDLQHQDDIIKESKGAYKQYPLLGVGAIAYLGATGAALPFKREIQVNLEADNYLVETITLDGQFNENVYLKAIRTI